MRGTRRAAAAAITGVFIAGLLIGGPAPTVTRAAVGNASWNDFNADGFADLAVGTPNDVVPSPTASQPIAAGSVTVYYGSPTGLDTTSEQVWHQDPPGLDGVPGNNVAGDRFGASVAAGDFDGDSIGDLAIGVPGKDNTLNGTFAEDRGQVVVLFGIEDVGITDIGSRVLRSVQRSAREFGAAIVALDDIAGDEYGEDGVADLAVGVPRADFGTSTSTHGHVSIYRGQDIAAGTLPTSFDDLLISSGIPPGRNAGIGRVLAAGDLDPEPGDDLIIGTPLADVQGPDGEFVTDAGMVLIWLTGGDGTLTGVSQGRNGVPGVPETGEQFGASVDAGDLDGDDDDDLAIGAPGEDSQANNAGQVTVVLWDDTAPDPFPSPIEDATVLHENQARVPDTSEAGDRFGTSVVIEQFGRGFGEDLAIGVRGENVGPDNDAGAVDVLYGGDGVIAASRQRWTQDADDVLGDAEPSDRFGEVLYAADIQQDLAYDLVIGVPREDALRVNQGNVHVLYAGGLGVRAVGDQILVQIGGDPSPPATNDRFGEVLP